MIINATNMSYETIQSAAERYSWVPDYYQIKQNLIRNGNLKCVTI